MAASGVWRNEVFRLLCPFHTGNGLRVVHEIPEPDVLKLFRGIQTVTVKMVKRGLRFINVH